MTLNRRAFLNTAVGSAVIAGRAHAAASKVPNILVLITDHLFSEALSCRMGDRYVRTPHMDSLAANGMFFTRAYCANPLCMPSRTSMFTGRYPPETGVEINDTSSRFSPGWTQPPIILDADKFPCMGTIFRQAGYETGYFGKWHLPYPEAQSDKHGFTGVNRGVRKGDAGTAAAAVEFISAKRQAPFLLVASFLNPHNICEWPRGEKLSEGPIGNPPAVDQCPPLRPNHDLPKNETDIMVTMRQSYQATPTYPVANFDEKKWREYLWAYYRLIEKVDGEIGKTLAALRRSGLEEETLVVLTSDHGDCQGSHGWNQKTVFYEESAHVPLILSYKGVTKPGVSSRLAHTGVDLIPTLCSYADIRVPAGLPGMNLKDTANGKSGKDPREYVVVCNKLVQGAEIDHRTPVPDGRMVRSQRYKYCLYSEGHRRESLVDLEKDPGEMLNLAGDPKYKKTLEHHRGMLAAWSSKIGDQLGKSMLQGVL